MNHSLVRPRVPFVLVALALLLPAPAQPQVPTPESVIGWRPGEDYKLADYGQISEYFHLLDAASDRMMLTEIGTTAEGRPMMLAIISSEDNLRQLDRWKDIARRLAMADGLTEDEARVLAKEGKAIVWIDGGLHATEVGACTTHIAVGAPSRVERRRRGAPHSGQNGCSPHAGDESRRSRDRDQVVSAEPRHSLRDGPVA